MNSVTIVKTVSSCAKAAMKTYVRNVMIVCPEAVKPVHVRIVDFVKQTADRIVRNAVSVRTASLYAKTVAIALIV